jgi:hypothetical protein
MRGEKADQVGLMRSDGTWALEPQFEYAAALTDGLAIVRKRIDGKTMSGAVDEDGNLVVPFRPWFVAYWQDGQAIVRNEAGKEALMDTQGEIVGGRWFDKVIQRAEDGDVAIVKVDGREIGLDRAGNIVPHPRNGRVIASCPSFRVVETDGLVQVTDAGGQPIMPHLLERPVSRPICEKPFSVQLNGKWGFVGVDGRLLADPPVHDSQYDFSEGHAWVRIAGKWGLIDTAGRTVIEPKYDNVGPSRAGLTQVKLDGKDIWVDFSGHERPEPAITFQPNPDVLDCHHGLRLIERDGRWGVIDSDKDVIAPRYRALSCFGNGVAWAPIDAQRRWCPIGPDGVLHDKPDCRTEFYPLMVTHSYPEKFSSDPYENSVLWTRAYLDFHAGKRDKPPQWVSGR